MKNKVTLRELVGSRIILAICIAVYYWCWARNDWHAYYTTIQNCVAIFTILYFCGLSWRERQYKKEVFDELADLNLRRSDAICFKVTTVAIVIIAFATAVLRFNCPAEVFGYILVGLLVVLSILRTVLFCIMDSKGA